MRCALVGLCLLTGRRDNKLSALKDVLGNVMKLGGNQDSANDKMNKADDLKAQSEAYNFDPSQSFAARAMHR